MALLLPHSLSLLAAILSSHLASLANAQTQIFSSTVDDDTEELNANDGDGGVVFDAYGQCAWGNCAQITGSVGEEVFLQTRLGYINCTGYTDLKIQYDLYPTRLRQNSYVYVYVWTNSNIANKEEITMYSNGNTAEGSLLEDEEFELDSSYDETDNLRIRWAIETQEQSETSIVYIDGIRVFGTAVPTSSPTKAPTNEPTANPTAVPSVAPTSPTTEPTQNPMTTANPTLTSHPTLVPTVPPTLSPTMPPALSPSKMPPTLSPSPAPSLSPLFAPTANPDITDQTTPQSASGNVDLYIFIIGLLLGILITILIIFLFLKRQKSKEQEKSFAEHLSSCDTQCDTQKTHSRHTTADMKQPGMEGGRTPGSLSTPRMIAVQSDSADHCNSDVEERNGFGFAGAVNLDLVAEEEKVMEAGDDLHETPRMAPSEREGVVLDENNLTVMPESPSSDHETTRGFDQIQETTVEAKGIQNIKANSSLSEEETKELDDVNREESRGSEQMYIQQNNENVDGNTVEQKSHNPQSARSPTDGSTGTLNGIYADDEREDE